MQGFTFTARKFAIYVANRQSYHRTKTLIISVFHTQKIGLVKFTYKLVKRGHVFWFVNVTGL